MDSQRICESTHPIDAEHFGHVWPLVSGTDTHFEGFARLNSIYATLSER